MKIIVDIKHEKQYNKYMNEFLNTLISDMQNDILNTVNYNKLSKRESYLLNCNLIKWTKKPTHIDMYKLVYLIVSNIEYKCIKGNTYMIYINPKTYFPNSRTKLELISRLLDKGNEVLPPIHFISRIFRKYKRNINRYFDSFISIKLRTIVTKKIKIK